MTYLNQFSLRTNFLRLLLALATVLLGLILFSCNAGTGAGDTYLSMKTDTAWVKFDSLEISFKDPATGNEEILFQGDPATLKPLK